MRSLVVCAFLVVLAVSVNANSIGNGRPGCKTAEEINVSLYRNIWDPTAYWKCQTLNEPAAAVRCPDEMAFQDKLKTCVTWEDWEWETPRAPPSTP